jgi:hypothetical protein
VAAQAVEQNLLQLFPDTRLLPIAQAPPALMPEPQPIS